MSKTLNNTATAKHIAAQHGLTFTYVRSARMWLLASRSFTPEQSHTLFASSVIADYSTDAFYVDCMRIAAHTMTPAQMDKVVIRARFAAMLDRLNMGEEFAPNSPDALAFVALSVAAECSDKQVHSMEDSIYAMREELDETHGTYSDHKDQRAPMVAIASYGKGKHIAYSVNGKSVMSFPAQLNGGRIPDLDDAALILEGDSVADACTAHNLTLAQPVCVAGQPLPAAFMVFVSWTRLTALHPTVAAEFELRKVSDGPVFPGAIYPVRVVAPGNVWVGEPCATQADAERAALAHLRSLPARPEESNAVVMARAVDFVRNRRLANEPTMFQRMEVQRAARTPCIDGSEHIGDPCEKCGACLDDDGATTCEECKPEGV